MPVVFQQPSPMAPGITAGAGAAQVMQQNNPTLARMYEMLRQAGRGGGGGGGGGGLWPAPARQGGGLGGGGYSGASQAPPTFSQAERIRMQQLMAADAAVDADDSLSDSDKQQYKAMIHAGLDPLKMKAEQAKQAMFQEQLKQVQTQGQLMAALRSTDHNIQSQAQESLKIRDDQGNEIGRYDLQGKPHFYAKGRSPAEAEAQDRERRAKEDAADYDAALKHAPKYTDENGKEQIDWDAVRDIAKERRNYRLGQQQAREMANQQGGQPVAPGAAAAVEGGTAPQTGAPQTGPKPPPGVPSTAEAGLDIWQGPPTPTAKQQQDQGIQDQLLNSLYSGGEPSTNYSGGGE